jgi:hypothetical protein
VTRGVRDEETILGVSQRCRDHPSGVRDEETIHDTGIELRWAGLTLFTPFRTLFVSVKGA